MSFSKSLLDANNATEESRVLTHPNERLMYKALESTSWQRCWVADNHELKRQIELKEKLKAVNYPTQVYSK